MSYSERLLGGVFLAGLTVWSCRRCELESPVVPRTPDLLKAITGSLFRQKGPLSGEELRFLRGSTGLLARDFAAALGVSPEHLSRAENDHRPLGETAERLVRVLAFTADSADGTGATFEALRDDLAVRERASRLFIYARGRWREAHAGRRFTDRGKRGKRSS